MHNKKKQYGVALLTISLLVMASLVIYQNSNAATAPSQPSPKLANAGQEQATYSNTTYGFSYSYPADWAPSGNVKNDPDTSATRQEFGTGLRLNKGGKNSNTVSFEVLDESLQTAEAWYDDYFAQTPIKVSKTINDLKARQSVQYELVTPTYETKLYLLAVSSKTYLFSSVNESLNVNTSDSYWSDFDATFKSLAISKQQ